MVKTRGTANRRARRSIRLAQYDYTQGGVYFVTICTKGRLCLLGSLLEKKVVLSPIGSVVKLAWEAIPRHFVGVALDSFVIMPDHLHGLIALPDRGRGTACRAPTRPEGEGFGRPIARSLPTIVRSMKSAVTREAGRSSRAGSIWQRGYYERVVRNEEELQSLRYYIESNPLRWADDEYLGLP